MNDNLGSIVSVPGTVAASGVLKYIGPINGKSGTFGGIELQGASAMSRGKNSGDVNGTLYFEVAIPKTGLFLPWERLVSANPHLSLMSRPVSSYRREATRTPTPTRRISYDKLEKSDKLDKISRISTARSLSSGSDSILSRQSSVRRPESRDGSRRIGSRNASGEKPAVPGRKGDHDVLEWKLKYEQKCREYEQKEAILQDLQNTVDKLQPVLEDYELSMDEKDRKIRKQKSEYERAREEWRQSLELMISSQQEAENLYEMQVSDLKEQLNLVGVSGGEEVRNAGLVAKNAKLQNELDELRKKTSLAQPAPEEWQLEKEQLEKKVTMLTQDVSSIEMMMQDMQATIRSKESHIVSLELQLEEATSKEMTSLSGDFGKMSVQENKMRAQISELEQKIKELEGNIPQGSDLEKELEKKTTQCSQLEKDLSESTQKLATSLQDVERLKNTIKELDEGNGNGDSVKLRKIIEDLEHELNMRPSFEELTELQNSLEDIETLHQDEIQEHQSALKKIREQNSELQEKIASLNELLQAKTHAKEELENRHQFDENRHHKFDALTNGSLPIYSPQTKTDPSEGRSEWCGLCERDGHDSLHCPYENDIF